MHKHGAGNAAQYARDLFRPAANDLYGVNAVIFRKAACHDMSGFVLYVDDITAGKFAGDSEYARWKQAVATRERLCQIGSASCRARVCQDGSISLVAVS